MTNGRSQSRDAAHFDRIYAGREDPWNFRGSPYEREKYNATIVALPPRHFAKALEIGCSIGELTRLLAPSCGRILGLDISEAPIATAQRLSAGCDNVTFRRMTVPAEWPDGTFDLIVLSEVLYFLAPLDIRTLADRITASLHPGGVVLLVNYLGHNEGDPLTGDDAAETFIVEMGERMSQDLRGHRDSFRIDRLVKITPPPKTLATTR